MVKFNLLRGLKCQNLKIGLENFLDGYLAKKKQNFYMQYHCIINEIARNFNIILKLNIEKNII